MGLSERKDKQRIGYDPRNLAWSGDKDRFSYKHMTALGWTDDSGIGGASLTGNAKHIAVVHKLDSSGIGMARAMKEGEAVGGQARAGLDDVLRRLASASGSASPTPSPAPEPQLSNRIASRRKHLQSKRLASSSPAALAEILGISPATVEDVKPSLDVKPTLTELDVKPFLDVKPSLSDLESRPVREAEDMVSTSNLSVSEYFRQKMRAKTIARQIAAGETPTIDPEPPIASSSKVAWEGTKLAFAEAETPLSFSDSPVESKEERRAAKALRKAEKEAKKAARAEAKAGTSDEAKVSKKKRKRDGDTIE